VAAFGVALRHHGLALLYLLPRELQESINSKQPTWHSDKATIMHTQASHVK
jgi:hypothetical protein